MIRPMYRCLILGLYNRVNGSIKLSRCFQEKELNDEEIFEGLAALLLDKLPCCLGRTTLARDKLNYENCVSEPDPPVAIKSSMTITF